MKKLLFIVFASMLPMMLTAQFFQHQWSEKTAYTLDKGKWESGLFQSFRYGLNPQVELRTNALLLPIFPNVGVKIALMEKGGWTFASEHAISYPTLLLKSLSFKGTGGFLSPEFSYPNMISSSNTLFATESIGSNALFTAEVGMSFSLRGQKLDYQSSIDYPVLYPRMAHYYQGALLRVGGSYKRMLSNTLFLEENAKLFLVTRNRDNVFLENAGTLHWAVGKSFGIRGGYNLSWGTYPFGNQWQLCPTIDLVFGSTK